MAKVLMISTEDLKLLEVQEKINKIREENKWTEIVLCFKNGCLAHWSEKEEHHY